MTDTAPRPHTAVDSRCREVTAGEAGRLADVLDADPAVACAAREFLTGPAAAGRTHGAFYTRGGPSRSLFFVSGTVQPLLGEDADMREFTAMLAGRATWPMSVHGRRDLVEALWSHLGACWGAPREYRDRQLLLALTDPPAPGEADRRVRRAVPDDLERYLPAAAAMYREELGADPFAPGLGGAFRRRTAQLLSGGRAWALVEDGRVVFKADVGALSPTIAQIQGVWVHPECRGHGIGSACMRAVFERLAAGGRTPTLVVNETNVPASRLYARLGMRTVAPYATVLTR